MSEACWRWGMCMVMPWLLQHSKGSVSLVTNSKAIGTRRGCPWDHRREAPQWTIVLLFFYGNISSAPGIHLNKPALKTQTSWQKKCLSPPDWQPPYSLLRARSPFPITVENQGSCHGAVWAPRGWVSTSYRIKNKTGFSQGTLLRERMTAQRTGYCKRGRCNHRSASIWRVRQQHSLLLERGENNAWKN